MPTPTPINLGPYVINVPSEAEKRHIRDSLDMGSAATLNGKFLDENRLEISDPNNNLKKIILDKILLSSSVAERLRNARRFNATGDVEMDPRDIPQFDGTSDITLPILIKPLGVKESHLAANCVVAEKIKNASITPAKFTLGGPIWNSTDNISLNKNVRIGNNTSTVSTCSIDFYANGSSTHVASIERASGANGILEISNSGTSVIKIRGASFSSDTPQTVTTTRQIIGSTEIVDNEINSGATEIAFNKENTDSSITSFLNTSVYDGKRNLFAKFFGETKTFETYGTCRAIKSSQTGTTTAGLESRDNATGNSLIALNCLNGSSALIRHVRLGNGVEIRNEADTAYANLKASNITATGNIIINNESPTLILQDTNHRSGMLRVQDNTFQVLRGSDTNSITEQALGNYWPLEINLNTNDAEFGADVSAASFTSRSSIRYKENITSIEDALDIVKQLKGVHYSWKQDSRKDIGLIAEDVQKILPELVKTTGELAEGIDYGKLTAVLIEAVKELSTRVEQLEKQLAQ